MNRHATVSTLGRNRPAIERMAAAVTLVLALSLAGVDANAESETPADESLRNAVVVEEIVVVGGRQSDEAASYERLLADPLRERIIKEIRELNLLMEELAWRRESAVLTVTPPRIRWGYDPRDADRSETVFTVAALPLDLVSPAPVLRIDF